MGQKASKFPSPVEAEDKRVGTFQSGIFNKKLKVGEIPVGDERGSGHIDTQFGVSREPVAGHKQSATLHPEQREREYFANHFATYTQQESKSGDKAYMYVKGVSYNRDMAVSVYPRNAKIVAPLYQECTRSLMLIPEQNFMVHATHEADFQYDVHENGQNEALLQDKPVFRCFVENMEPDVPKELVTFEN